MTNLLALIAALIVVESQGDDIAVGDDGRAFGCLQIHAEYVEDVNRIAGASYVHEDAFDRDKAIKMVTIYLTHYCRKERLGRVATFEDLARCHNGGPNGYRRESTIKYWRQVETILPSKL